ncbi:MAG: NADH-quinone oxidoreductase subunit J [Thermoprotei archaeon]
MSLLIEVLLTVGALTFMLLSVLVVEHRSMIYSALMLAFLGLLNAALLYSLGFPLLAFVQIVIYVGASVLFLAVSISLLKEPPEAHTGMGKPVLAFVSLVALGIALLASLAQGFGYSVKLVSYVLTASRLVAHGGTAVLLIFVLLAATMTVSVTVSTTRGEKA